MAEKRKKSSSILLVLDGKTLSLELFDAALWPERSSTEGLYRVRLDGRWYAPAGKYTFLPLCAVGELVARLLSQEAPLMEEERPGLRMRQRVRVLFGDCAAGVPLQKRLAFTLSPPWRGVDGRWHVFVGLDGYVREVPCHDIEPLGPEPA